MRVPLHSSEVVRRGAYTPTLFAPPDGTPPKTDLDVLYDTGPWNPFAKLPGYTKVPPTQKATATVIPLSPDELKPGKRPGWGPPSPSPVQDEKHPWGFDSTFETGTDPQLVFQDARNFDTKERLDSVKQFAYPEGEPSLLPLKQPRP
jgi:hypothetical protein